MVKRLTTEKRRQEIKENKKFKNKSFSTLNQKEKDELLELLAKKAGLI